MYSNTLRLDGRVVLVTGASSGIGVRFARQCAAAGAAVVLAARRKERLEALAEELAASNARVLPVVMDVADEDSVMAAFDAAEEAFGPITSIVANAGVTVSGRALDFDITDWDLIYAINVRGVFDRTGRRSKDARGGGRGQRQDRTDFVDYCKNANQRYGSLQLREGSRHPYGQVAG